MNLLIPDQYVEQVRREAEAAGQDQGHPDALELLDGTCR
jgi:hypothetical protein